MSGGRASVQFKRGKKNQTQLGDISAIDPLGDKLIKLCVVECKTYKNLNLRGLFTGAQAGLNGFWEVLVKLCAKNKRLPLLIAKENNLAPFVCLNSAGVELFECSEQVEAYFPGAYDLLLVRLEDFLAEAKPPK